MGFQEFSDRRADRVLRIDAAGIRREHVGVGLLAPFRPVEAPARDRDARLLRVLRSFEKEGAGRDDAESALGDGVLDGGCVLGRARLVVDDQGDDFVPIDTALRILQRDAGFESFRCVRELRSRLAGQRRDQGQGDGCLVRGSRRRSGRDGRQRSRSDDTRHKGSCREFPSTTDHGFPPKKKVDIDVTYAGNLMPHSPRIQGRALLLCSQVSASGVPRRSPRPWARQARFSG